MWETTGGGGGDTTFLLPFSLNEIPGVTEAAVLTN